MLTETRYPLPRAGQPYGQAYWQWGATQMNYGFAPSGKTTLRVQVGEKGLSYRFRVRAIDNVGNTSAWVESETATVQTAVTKYYYLAGQRIAMRQGSALTYLYGDHLGSTSLITNASGAVVAETRYLPYGQAYWQWGASQTDFGFTGQRMDGFGLMDYNARYYDPLLGRFISPDSIIPQPGSPLAWDRYGYTSNNPINYIDPSGHAQKDLEGPGCFDDECREIAKNVAVQIFGDAKWANGDPSAAIGQAEKTNDQSNPNLLNGLTTILEFANGSNDFLEVVDIIDNHVKPLYKQIKGTLPGGILVEGSLGAITQYSSDINNTAIARPFPEMFARALTVGIEDAITGELANMAAIPLATGAGAACTAAAPFCAGAAYLAVSNGVTLFMDYIVWAPINNEFEISR